MNDNKPTVERILALHWMKKQAADLYKNIDLIVKDLCDEFGEGWFDYDLVDVNRLYLMGINPEEKRYMKFEITDNVRKMQDGEDVWNSVGIKPVTFTTGQLKNCPKSLK